MDMYTRLPVGEVLSRAEWTRDNLERFVEEAGYNTGFNGLPAAVWTEGDTVVIHPHAAELISVIEEGGTLGWRPTDTDRQVRDNDLWDLLGTFVTDVMSPKGEPVTV